MLTAIKAKACLLSSRRLKASFCQRRLGEDASGKRKRPARRGPSTFEGLCFGDQVAVSASKSGFASRITITSSCLPSALRLGWPPPTWRVSPRVRAVSTSLRCSSGIGLVRRRKTLEPLLPDLLREYGADRLTESGVGWRHVDLTVKRLAEEGIDFRTQAHHLLRHSSWGRGS